MRVLYTLLIALLLLAGCAGEPTRPTHPIPEAVDAAARADQAFADGDYLQAARIYSRLAHTAAPPLRYDYRLNAADALRRAERMHDAQQIINSLTGLPLTDAQLERRRLLEAHLALYRRDGAAVLELLAAPFPAGAPRAWLADYYELKGHAYKLEGNHFEAARHLILHDALLTDDEAIAANQQAIWQALAMVSEGFLANLRTLTRDNTFSGWLELAHIAKAATDDATALEQQIRLWRSRYPGHPIRPEFLDGLLDRGRLLRERPAQVALLLPLSGQFSSAALAIRDGVIAAHYGNSAERKSLRIYDLGDDPAEVMSVYRQAVEAGAEAVIGPLSRAAVELLAREEALPVPTLALNFVDAEPLPNNLFQYALSPEDEAREVADYAWLEGHSQSAILVPDTEWGERVEQAYRERWAQLGGVVVSHARYDPRQSDFSSVLKRMLNLDQSENRQRRLTATIGTRAEFQPRPRQDVEYIFLAAQPRQARLIRPQLRFHHAASVPIYATSHVFTGDPNRSADRDMDGIIFADMPRTLDETAGPRILAAYQGQLKRLVAMGSDAYNVLPMLEVLAQYPYERFHGATGTLRLDDQYRLRRQLAWAQFVSGQPRLLEALPHTVAE